MSVTRGTVGGTFIRRLRRFTQRGIAATKASFRSRVPLPASSCGERETRSAGEGRFARLDLPSAAPSSAFGTFSPAKTAGEKDSRSKERARTVKENLRGARRIYGLVVLPRRANC